jgi:hypothetical protein
LRTFAQGSFQDRKNRTIASTGAIFRRSKSMGQAEQKKGRPTPRNDPRLELRLRASVEVDAETGAQLADSETGKTVARGRHRSRRMSNIG